MEYAVKIAEYYKTPKEIELNLWLMFGPICEAYHFRNQRKAKLLKYAHWCYFGSIACLLVPMIVVASNLLG